MPGYMPIAALMAVACALLAQPARADDSAATLRAELDALRADYAPARGAGGAHRGNRFRRRPP